MTGRPSHRRNCLPPRRLPALLLALVVVGSGTQAQERKAASHPTSVESISVDESAMIREAFVRAFGKEPAVSPDNAASSSSGVSATVVVAEKAVAAPADRDRKRALIQSAVRDLQYSSSHNIAEILFVVLQESIKGTNEDKKYFLQKLHTANDVGEQLSQHLRDLADQSQRLATKERQESTAGRAATMPATVLIVDSLTFATLDVRNRRAKLCDPCLTRRNCESVGRGAGGGAE